MMPLPLNSRIMAGFLASIFTILTQSACTADKPTKKAEEPVGPGRSTGGLGGGESREDAGATSLSADRRFLVNSLSNNPFTSKTIDRSRAADFAGQHSGGRSKDINTLAATVAALRLSGQSVNEGMVNARAIADLEMAKNVDRDIPEIVQLELGLIGLQTGRLAFAEYWLDRLLKSKSATMRASAINAKGVMAIRMDRIPEAIVLFKEALKESSDYRPALLNIGFLALQGGDVTTAKRALAGMQDDWYVESGLISVLRLEGESEKAESLCERVLSKRPRHKPTLINCGINSWQGRKDYRKARDYLNKALAVAGGSAVWDEKTGRLLGAIDSEEARVAQLKARKEAEDLKVKADAAKDKPTPAQDQPAKDSGESKSQGESSRPEKRQ
jgi:tetratricopeptide (TPR) repeat protein